MTVPVITPVSPQIIDALVVGTYVDRISYPPTIVSITSNINATFSVVGGYGTLTIVDAKHATWIPPNIDGVYTIKVADASVPGDFTNLVITVRSIMQPYWEWRTAAKTGSDIDIFEPEQGPEQSITRSGYRERYDMGSEDTGYAEFLEMRQFYRDHHLSRKPFVIFDPTINRRSTYLTDSEFEWHANHPQSYYWAFKVKEAYPYGTG